MAAAARRPPLLREPLRSHRDRRLRPHSESGRAEPRCTRRAFGVYNVKNLLDSLKRGDWRALLASFLYFDTGFTVWVMYGPLAPAIAKDYALNDAQKAFLVAVPALAAAILRVTFGNMYQAIDGRRLALVGIALSAIPPAVLMSLPG